MANITSQTFLLMSSGKSSSLTDVLKQSAPEIEELTRVSEREFSFISGDKTFNQRGLYADSNFFDLFTFPLIHSASRNVLADVKSQSYSFFRQSLIVFQFVIPIILIICMMIIKAQDSFMRNYDVGVDQDKVIVLDKTVKIRSHSESFKTELLAIPGIDAVSFTNCIPTRGVGVSTGVNWEGKDAAEKLHFWCVNSDFDYNKAVTVKMVEGRYFSTSFSTDSTSYIINNIAAGVMKKEHPVGSVITVEGQKGTVIGVFKDFHSVDLRGPYVPTIISLKSSDRSAILIKYSSGSFPAIIDKIRGVYKHYESEASFNPTLFRDLIPYSNLSLPSSMVGLAFIISLLLGQNFLARFNFRTPIPIWAFLAGPTIASIVAIMTVISQTWSVANRNPVKSLRYE